MPQVSLWASLPWMLSVKKALQLHKLTLDSVAQRLKPLWVWILRSSRPSLQITKPGTSFLHLHKPLSSLTSLWVLVRILA